MGQVNRIIQWSFPVNKVNFEFFGNALLLAAIFVSMGIFLRRQATGQRIIYLLLLLSGFGWLIPLRNLAAFHDYTTMYYIGIPLVFYLALLIFWNPSKRISYFILLISLVVFVSAIFQLKHWHESLAGNANLYTYDFMQIDAQIVGTGNNIYFKNDVPFAPYISLFYLKDQIVAPEELSDYAVSPNRNFWPDNLTPHNHLMFLFKK